MLPGQLLQCTMRKSITSKYIEITQGMYVRAVVGVKLCLERTSFLAGVGQHEGSVLSPFSLAGYE